MALSTVAFLDRKTKALGHTRRMMFEAEPRQRNLKCSETLDRLLGIDLSQRTPHNGEVSLASPQRVQQLERPTTRHGRHTVEETSTSTTSNASEKIKQVDRWQRSSDNETQSSDEDFSEDEFIKRLNNIRRASVKFGNGKPDMKKSDVKATAALQSAANSAESKNKVLENDLRNNASSVSTTTVGSSSMRPASSTSSKSSSASRRSSAKENAKVIKVSSHIPSASKAALHRKLSIHSPQQRTFRIRSSSADNSNKKVLKPLNDRSSLAGLSNGDKSSHEAREQRRKEAEKSFNNWKEKTDALIMEKRKLEKEKAEALKREQEEEKERKRAESQKIIFNAMFEAWRKERSRQISANKSMQKRKEEALKKKAEEEAAAKKREAQKAFQAWCNGKRAKEVETLRRNMESRRTQETQSRNEKEYKDALAKEAYDLWLEMKDRERAHAESLHGRILRFEDEAHGRWPIPWIPPSNIVPRKFTPTGRRRQSTKTATQRNLALVVRSRSAH
ncbi:Microtubule-associated protein 9 [Toxocara canis]|uniref:Microtubule-associated protein 9 n=1 Tax=Toxocara canis TaxID=6265 RepID=A0A0B2VLH4_TOXCA|nr:Microtubule-associated protein 9 [Toxocara canis]